MTPDELFQRGIERANGVEGLLAGCAHVTLSVPMSLEDRLALGWRCVEIAGLLLDDPSVLDPLMDLSAEQRALAHHKLRCWAVSLACNGAADTQTLVLLTALPPAKAAQTINKIWKAVRHG